MMRSERKRMRCPTLHMRLYSYTGITISTEQQLTIWVKTWDELSWWQQKVSNAATFIDRVFVYNLPICQYGKYILAFHFAVKCEKTPGKMMLCSKKDEESLFINYYKAVTILWYRRDVIEKVKYQFWPLDKKLRMVSQAKLFLRYNPSIISCRRPLKRTLFKIPLQAPAVRNGVYSPSEEDSAELPEAGPHLDPPDHGEPPQVYCSYSQVVV